MVHNEQLLPKTKQNLFGFMEKMTFKSQKKKRMRVGLYCYKCNIAISGAKGNLLKTQHQIPVSNF